MWGHQHSQEEKHNHGSRAKGGTLASTGTASWERSQRSMVSMLSETWTRDPTGPVCPKMQCRKRIKAQKWSCPSLASGLTNSNETGWDHGLFHAMLQCCSARTWTQLSSNNKILIQRNRKKLKITVCMLSWSKCWTQKTERDHKPQLPVLKSLEYKNCVSGAKQDTGHAHYTHTHTHTHTHTPPLWPDPRTDLYPHPT